MLKISVFRKDYPTTSSNIALGHALFPLQTKEIKSVDVKFKRLPLRHGFLVGIRMINEMFLGDISLNLFKGITILRFRSNKLQKDQSS